MLINYFKLLCIFLSNTHAADPGDYHPPLNYENIVRCNELICEYTDQLKKIANGSNVHVIDKFMQDRIDPLKRISGDLGVVIPETDAKNMKEMISALIVGNPLIYQRFTDDGGRVFEITNDELISLSSEAISTASTDPKVLYFFNASLFMQNLLTRRGQDTNQLWKGFFDAIVENKKTGGGCFAGVRNRIMLHYINVLHNVFAVM